MVWLLVMAMEKQISRSGIRRSVEEACVSAYGAGTIHEDFVSHFHTRQKAATTKEAADH